MVDFILGLRYHQIDLDEEPCIFPACGHFVAKSSIDGFMDMKAHYTMSPEGDPTAVTGVSRPFSKDEVKTCSKIDLVPGPLPTSAANILAGP